MLLTISTTNKARGPALSRRPNGARITLRAPVRITDPGRRPHVNSTRASSHNRDPGVHDRVHYNISVHGRHVDVTPELEELVKGRLVPVIDKFRSPAILESEGGVRDVDVKLMNTSAEIRVQADVLNKQLHDTYLRRGEIQAIATGCADVYDSFETAAQQLESKLKSWAKTPTRKTDPKHSSQLRQHGSTGGWTARG